MKTDNLKFNSKLIHGGDYHDPLHSATVPIYQTSTFAFENADHGAACFSGEEKGYIYTRIGNPTIDALENLVAELEGGAGAIAVSSGMAAVNTIYFGLLSKGDHIVSSVAVYGPSRVVMENYYSRYGILATYVNTSNPDEVRAALRPETRMLFVETPANPTIDITDLQLMAQIARQHNILLVVDNTFSSPYLQRPLDLGADVVFHSMTKFLNGHADVVAGIVVAKRPDLVKVLRSVMINLGCNMDPHQAYLVIRGIKTLAIRMDRAQENASKIAAYLHTHSKIAWIRYPGLANHPQHELALRQMDGPGTMISFGVKGGFEAGKKLMNNMKVALLAVSLGGVETLIQHPASMTHSKMTAEARLEAGITDDLVRYAVGIEDATDLINDLDQALASI